ncbi:MAG: hypothetical protein ACKOAX_14005, partial [Candidatus Kapaibacterium sp.]
AGEYTSFAGELPAIRYTSTALGWAKEYPITDHLGSTRLVLRPFEPGNASRADYEPFGKAILSGSFAVRGVQCDVCIKKRSAPFPGLCPLPLIEDELAT